MIIGITGGIGSGKSSVAKILARYLQTYTISADEVAHSLTNKNGAGIPYVRKVFGEEYILPDGSMNRNKMREVVFTDPQKKQELEYMLKPLIHSRLLREIEECLTKHSFAVVEIPLLVESGDWSEKCDEIVVVDCSVETQIKRVKVRNNLQEDEIKAIIANQVTSEERKKVATQVIMNDGEGTKELELKVQLLALKFLEKMA